MKSAQAVQQFWATLMEIVMYQKHVLDRRVMMRVAGAESDTPAINTHTHFCLLILFSPSLINPIFSNLEHSELSPCILRGRECYDILNFRKVDQKHPSLIAPSFNDPCCLFYLRDVPFICLPGGLQQSQRCPTHSMFSQQS
jgi:hypothetical protein